MHTDAYCNQCVNFFTLFSPNLHTDHQCVNRPVLGTAKTHKTFPLSSCGRGVQLRKGPFTKN